MAKFNKSFTFFSGFCSFCGAFSGVIIVLLALFLLSSCSISYTYVNQKYADTEKNKTTITDKMTASPSLVSPSDTLRY